MRIRVKFHPAKQEDAEVLLAFQEQFAAEEVLLLGRQTFEDFRGYWPLQTDDVTGVTAHLNRVQKVVVTSGTADAAGRAPRCCTGRSRTGCAGCWPRAGASWASPAASACCTPW